MLLLIAACVATPDDQNGRPTHPANDSGDGDVGDNNSDETAPSLAVPEWISLPYVSVGDARPSGVLTVQNVGNEAGEWRVTAEGEFSVRPASVALAPGEFAEIVVEAAFSTNAPTVASGVVTFEWGDTLTAGVSAVVGNPDLDGATWKTDDWGTYTILDLPSAPFPDGVARYTDSSVLIALPPTPSDDGEIGIVTHLHGHNATVEEVVKDQYLREQFAASGRNAVLIVPQGPVEAADSDFGKLDQAGGFSDLVLDVLAVLYRDQKVLRPELGSTVLTSHSGGYNATANMIEQGGLPIHAVHLFDSLYGREETYEAFARAGGILRSVYTAGGGTDDNNAALADTLEEAGMAVATVFNDGSLENEQVNIGYSGASHAGVVSEDRAFARWLAFSRLPRRASAAPDFLAADFDPPSSDNEDDEGDVEIELRADADFFGTIVEVSTTGESWSDARPTDVSELRIDAAEWIRLRSDDALGEPGDSMGATGTEWLVVDGFDRILGGSWPNLTHDFVPRVGNCLPGTFSSATNEAVAEGRVQLPDYDHVIWLLGDESTADITFGDVKGASEQDKIEAYLAGGGKLVVSGSEVGYATSSSWLSSVLHASYVSDDAGTTKVEGWTVGNSYVEDYPDVLSGSETLWKWETGGAAAVGWNNQVVVVGFGLENLSEADRRAALAELGDYFGG